MNKWPTTTSRIHIQLFMLLKKSPLTSVVPVQILVVGRGSILSMDPAFFCTILLICCKRVIASKHVHSLVCIVHLSNSD